MPLTPRDPLLVLAKAALWFSMAIMGFVAIACIIAIPSVWLAQGHIAGAFAKEGASLPMSDFLWALTALLLLSSLMFGVGVRFFQLLKRIVGTVGEGDPFVPVNAARLTQMAWLSVMGQAIIIPLAGTGLWLYRVTEPIREKSSGTFVIDGGLDFSSILLTLVLFVLARVFREGARMREELEGTV